MLYLDIPSARDLETLNRLRSDVCVSIYLPTTPISQDVQASRITFGNLARTAIGQLQDAGTDKRVIAAVQGLLDGLREDHDFWRFQAHSLAVLATPEAVRTYRLANQLREIVVVSDRFHLKPLLRAVTFPQAAYILAISENAVRLIEVSADLPAATVMVPGLPAGAADAVGKSSVNDRSPSGRLQGSEGQTILLTQFVRKVDAALRPLLAADDTPVILAATQPIVSLFRAVSTVPVLPDVIAGSPDRMGEADLASAARPILDAYHAAKLAEFRDRFERMAGQGRVTTDIADAARAATFGSIESLLIDMDDVLYGTVEEETGAIHLDGSGAAHNYGVVDEIAGRALRTGARVLAVRRPDIPGGGALAAILRHPI